MAAELSAAVTVNGTCRDEENANIIYNETISGGYARWKKTGQP